MGIIKALKLMHDYYKYDENGHIEETHRALDDINLDIEQGQFIAVLGHNGSGKSTLAKHINALLYPTEGAMVVDGINTSTEEESGKYVRKPAWYFRIPIIRLLVRLWKKMSDLVRKIWVWKRMKSGEESIKV